MSYLPIYYLLSALCLHISRPLRPHSLVSHVEIQTTLHPGEEGLWGQKVFPCLCVTQRALIMEHSHNACSNTVNGGLHIDSALTGGKGKKVQLSNLNHKLNINEFYIWIPCQVYFFFLGTSWGWFPLLWPCLLPIYKTHLFLRQVELKSISGSTYSKRGIYSHNLL